MAKQNKHNLQKTLAKITAATFAFILFWVLFQAPYMLDFNILGIQSSNPNRLPFFVLYSVWTCVISLIVILVWKFKINDFSFLKLKNKKWLLLYIIPLVSSAILISRGEDLFGINCLIYLFFTYLSIFIGQDLIAFGFYQQYLEYNTNKKIAAVIVTICFFLSHFIFITPSIADLPMIAIYLIGFTLFSWSRYKTGNIYILNVIHLSFGLVMSLI